MTQTRLKALRAFAIALGAAGAHAALAAGYQTAFSPEGVQRFADVVGPAAFFLIPAYSAIGEWLRNRFTYGK